MANKLPTSLGTPAIPQAGNVRRGIAQLGSPGGAFIEGARMQGDAWHRTAAGLQTVGDAFDKVQLRDDKKESIDYTNQYVADVNKLMWGDGTDQNPGFMNLKGDGAVKAAPTFQEQIQKLRQGYLEKGSNKQVRELFDQASIELTLPTTQDILQHAGKQKVVAADATDDATIDTFTDNLARNPLNAETRNQSLLMITNSVKSKLARQGITDPVVINDEVRKATSAALADAVNISISRDLGEGKALYGLYQDQLSADQQFKLEENIKTEERAKQAQAEHNLLMQLRREQMVSDARNEQIFQLFADPKTRNQVTPDLISGMVQNGLKANEGMLWVNTLMRQEEDNAKTALAQQQSQSFVSIMSNLKDMSDSAILMSPLDEGTKSSMLTRKQELLKGEKNALWEANEQSLANDWLVRPETITKQRIAGMALPESTKRIYNGMIDEAAKAPKQVTDWNTYDSVLNGIKTGAITNTLQILDKVGKGLTEDNYTNLTKFMNDRNKPENDAQNKLWDDMVKAAKQQLDNSIEGFIKDSKGLEQTNKFESTAKKEFDKRIEKGEDWRALLDPTNKDSLYKLIDGFRRSSSQIWKDTRGTSVMDEDAQPPKDYTNPADLKADVANNIISLDEAKRIYREKGWDQAPVQTPTPVTPTAPTGY